MAFFHEITFTSLEVFFAVAAIFLLFIFPGITFLTLNFLTRKLLNIENIFRHADMKFYNRFHPNDARKEVTDDVPRVFGQLIFLTSLIYFFIMASGIIRGNEVFYADQLIAILFLSIISAVILKIVGGRMLEIISEKRLNSVDDRLIALGEKIGFIEKTKFGLRRSYKNEEFFLSGIHKEYFQKKAKKRAVEKKSVILKLDTGKKRDYYITLEDGNVLKSELGPEISDFILANQLSLIYNIYMSRGLIIASINYEDADKFEGLLDIMIKMKAVFRARSS